MAFNYSKLKGRIVEKFGSQQDFSKAMEISENSLSRKLNNKMAFTSNDIVKACELLEIKANDVGSYFFIEKV